MSDMNFKKSTFGYVFSIGDAIVSWGSIKQQYIADSTTEVEYVVATKATKEAVWLKSKKSSLYIYIYIIWTVNLII